MSDSLASMTGRKRDGRQEEEAAPEDEKDGHDGRDDEE